MKIAITSQGETLDHPVDERFGRAKGFIVYDTESQTFYYQENVQSLNAVQGAGIQAADQLIRRGIQVLITGQVGPKAFTVLKEAKIALYAHAKGSVREALAEYHSGTLMTTLSATKESHW